MLHQYGRRDRAAFTLIELAIVMGVIAAIMGAIWYAASNARELQKENAALTELQTVAQNMVNMMEGQTLSALATPCAADPTSHNNITCYMILPATGVIPTSYANSADPTTADNPWAPKLFKIFEAGDSNPHHFRLSFYNVPFQGCMALLMQATACDVGQLGCPIGASTNQGNGFGAEVPSLPPVWMPGMTWQTKMNTGQAKQMCEANTGSATNSVEFDYSL